MSQTQHNAKKLPEILRGCKTFSAHRINQMRHNSGVYRLWLSDKNRGQVLLVSYLFSRNIIC